MKYDNYKKLYFSKNIVKTDKTTKLDPFGKKAEGFMGNEAIEMVEWINERIVTNDILTNPSASTNLSVSYVGDSLQVNSSTGADVILPVATTLKDGVMAKADKISLNSLVTLTGVSTNSLNLGTFAGSIIPDNQTIKQALQSLESYVGSLSGGTTGNLTSISSAITVTGGINAVNGTGTSLQLIPSLISLDSLGGNLSLSKLQTLGIVGGQLARFNGVSWEAWTPNYTALPSGGLGDILIFNGSTWVNVTPRKFTQNISSGNIVTIPHSTIPNTFTDVFLNGSLLEEGVDYIKSGSNFTFIIAFKTGDKVTIKYYS